MPDYVRNAATVFNTRDGRQIYSILNINLENEIVILVYPGTLGQNDIWIKYKRGRSRIRTPKHIHWTVDLLIKKFINRPLTTDLLRVFLNGWNNVAPLNNREPGTIIENMVISQNEENTTRFAGLNAIGFFRVDFLIHLMELLMLQEKSNNPNAYMFGRVLDGLLNSNDLYRIISNATQTQRR